MIRKTLILCFILFTLFFFLSKQTFAATFTVNATTDEVDASAGDGNCATAGSVCTLRAAVQEANALAGTDTINIPAGTFTMTIAGSGENAAATGDYDITSNMTISGASKTTTIIDANSLDRMFHVFGGGYTVAISNMTIKNGAVTNYGGGIYVQPTNATFSLTNISFESNSGGNGGQGGGVYSNSPVTGTGLTFTSNTAHGGAGALYFYSGSTSITNSTFTSNQANLPSGSGWGQGGAIYNDNSALTLTNVTFNNNIAGQGGAMYFNGGSLTGDQLTFTNNNNPDPAYTGWTLAGAIYFLYPGSVTISNSTFSGNRIKNGVGGAIQYEGSGTISITDTSFTDNYSAGNGGLGDGGGGAINIPTSGPTLNLSRVTFSGNQAKYGGAIYSRASDGTYTNVTISGNTATAQGGGLYIYGKVKNLVNCTIANNTAPSNSGGGIYDNSGTNTALYLKNSIIANNTDKDYVAYDGSSVPNSQGYNICSDTSCNSFLTATGDSTSTSPLLGSLGNNGGPVKTMALLSNSPAMDTGTNTGCPSTDARGVKRPEDGDNNGTSVCDIGAYEYSWVAPAVTSVYTVAIATAGPPDPNKPTGYVEAISSGQNYQGTPSFIGGETGKVFLGKNRGDDLNIIVSQPSLENIPVLPWTQGLNTVSEITNFKTSYAMNGFPFDKELNQPAIIQMSYDPSRLSGQDPSQLRIAYYDTQDKKWVVIGNNTVLDAPNHKIANTGKVLGYYTVVVYPSGSGGGALTQQSSSLSQPSAQPVPSNLPSFVPETKVESLPKQVKKSCLINLFGFIKLFCR